MRQRMTRAVGLIVAVGVLGIAVWLSILAANGLSGLVRLLQPAEQVTLLTAAFTVIGSTLAVMIGRSLEKRRELDALHRDKKIPIYDEFLTGILTGFQDPAAESFTGPKFLEFLKTWHRRLILWGGSEVVQKYAAWMSVLRAQSADPTVESFIALEEVLRAIRKELGHRDSTVKKGLFIGFLLRQPELMYEAIRSNPNMKMSQLAALERERETSAS